MKNARIRPFVICSPGQAVKKASENTSKQKQAMLLWLQPSVGTQWTASGTVMMTAALSRCQRRRCAHVEPTSCSIREETPSPRGLPAPQSPVSPFKSSVRLVMSGTICFTSLWQHIEIMEAVWVDYYTSHHHYLQFVLPKPALLSASVIAKLFDVLLQCAFKALSYFTVLSYEWRWFPTVAKVFISMSHRSIHLHGFCIMRVFTDGWKYWWYPVTT